MNTIKFSPINDIRKETSNVEVYSIKDLEINHKKYQYFTEKMDPSGGNRMGSSK